MIIYLLKSATCLALLWAFYHFVLEKEKMHNFNRFYLLGSLIFSFLAPLYIIYIDVAPLVIESTQQTFDYIPQEISTSDIIIEESIDYTSILIGLYALVSFVFLIRFAKNLVQIISKIRKNEKIKYQKAILVLVDDNILPHTFWNYIFINKNEYKNNKVEQELFTHELTHVTQKHTLDIVILELAQAIFWVNPFFILLKKSVQLNHEFLADEKVINQHKNTFQYQHLLLNKAAWKNEYYLASNLNYSLTKKRLKMMTTQSSQTKILLKKLAVIPLLAGFIFLFAERVEAQEIIEIKEEPVETIVEEVASNSKKLSESEIYKEYFHSRGFFTFKDKNGKKISKKYSELNDEEKKRLVPPPPLKSKKKIPTQQLIEKLKDGEKYAVWIDGKVIKNEVLNNYKASDFSSHFVSFVHKNARSKRFPQNYQAHLSTHKHFKAENDKRVKRFKSYLEERNKVKEVVETPVKKIIEIKEQKNSKQSISNSPSFSGFQFDNSTLKAYNTLAKKYNAIPIKKRIIKLKDLNTLESLYNRLSNEEKATAQPFPECYLPNKVSNSLEKYNKINKQYENFRNKKPHFIKSSVEKQNELQEMFSLLGTLYFKLSKENKRKTKRPIHPHHPYVRLMKNNKVFYKKREELTEEDKLLFPPPPIPKNASKADKIRYEKAYYEWKKRTGNTFKNIPPPPKKNK